MVKPVQSIRQRRSRYTASTNLSPSAFESLNLTINSLKTNILNFVLRTAGKLYGPAIAKKILLADSTLEEVSSSKFLGMHLDRELTWNEQIDHVCTTPALAFKFGDL
ncbi:hypothetical protein J6590_069989 [Homalodisca vitripennis]|nr:hypothetical protein J6590_069989 [Homalodisca vitripennis]